MFGVRIHGWGGQGVVTAAAMLSVAAFAERRYASASPGLGSEHTGAPMVAFCRIDDEPVRLRTPILEPDAVIVQDSMLLHRADVFAGLKPGGYILINSNHSFEGLGLGGIAQRFGAGQLATVPATDIARRELGRPLPNVALLGAFAALTGIVSLASVETAIREQFSGYVVDGNVAAADDGFAFVQYERRQRERLAPA